MNRFLPQLCALALLAGCASGVTRDIKIETDADPKVDFSGYSTYNWLGSASIVHDPEGQWEPPEFDADAEIRFLIDREMRARGLVVNKSEPELLVFYGAGINMTKTEARIDPDSRLEKLANVPKGALKVILVDARTQRPIWGGVATADLQQGITAEANKKRIDYAVRSMFKQLPR